MSVSNIGDLRAEVASRVQDEAGRLTSTAGGDVDKAIGAAVTEFSKTRPLELSVILNGTGAFDYATTLLQVRFGTDTPAVYAVWSDRLSSATAVEYPYDATNQSPNWQESNEWTIRRLPTGSVLHFNNITPAVGEQFLVEFTAMHLVDTVRFTIDPADAAAFADLCASEVCMKLAGIFIQASRAAIGADSVQYITKSREYREQAASWRKEYAAKMFGDSKAPLGPASAVGSIDAGFSNDVDRYHYHGRRFR